MSEGGGAGRPRPPSLGLNTSDLPKCQQGFDGGIDRIDAKGNAISILTPKPSTLSNKDASNY